MKTKKTFSFFQICGILCSDYRDVLDYFMTTVTRFAIKFQSQDLDKDQLPDAPRPATSNLLESVVNDMVSFVVESSTEEVATNY